MTAPRTILHGRRLVLARAAWIVLAVVVLGLDVAGIPVGYSRYAQLCTLPPEVCAEESLLAAEDAARLSEIGISRQIYAAYQGVGQETVFTLVCFLVALVIFLRRSDDPMALFTAFVLLLFGGAGAAGTMRSLAEAYPVFWFPVRLLDYLAQVSFGVLFYLFPNGRFVPRWTRWMVAAELVFFVPDIFFPDSALADWIVPWFTFFVASLIVAQVYRFRYVSSAEQRQQTKWVVFGFSVGLTGFLAVLGIATYLAPVMLGRLW